VLYLSTGVYCGALLTPPCYLLYVRRWVLASRRFLTVALFTSTAQPAGYIQKLKVSWLLVSTMNRSNPTSVCFSFVFTCLVTQFSYGVFFMCPQVIVACVGVMEMPCQMSSCSGEPCCKLLCAFTFTYCGLCEVMEKALLRLAT